LSASDEDEDDFAAVYSRLVKVFRTPAPLTIVFPLSLRLFKKVPPERLEVYKSLSQWSSFKLKGKSKSNWIEEGIEQLQQATEEQYRTRPLETHTEVTRREKTVLRQEMADDVMERYLCSQDRVELSKEEFRRQIELAKEETIRDEEKTGRWAEKMRIKAAAEKAENRRWAAKWYKDRMENWAGSGFNHKWRIVIVSTAFAVAVIAIMKGYQYI
jgi:hypothetical protein